MDTNKDFVPPGFRGGPFTAPPSPHRGAPNLPHMAVFSQHAPFLQPFPPCPGPDTRQYNNCLTSVLTHIRASTGMPRFHFFAVLPFISSQSHRKMQAFLPEPSQSSVFQPCAFFHQIWGNSLSFIKNVHLGVDRAKYVLYPIIIEQYRTTYALYPLFYQT